MGFTPILHRAIGHKLPILFIGAALCGGANHVNNPPPFWRRFVSSRDLYVNSLILRLDPFSRITSNKYCIR